MSPLPVNAKSLNDLAQICEVPLESLRAALSHLRAVKDDIVSPKVLRTRLAASLKEDAAHALTTQLMGLAGMMRHTGASATEATQRLTLALLERWKNEPDRLKRWDQIATVIQEFLSHEHVRVVAKALDLSFDFENNYSLARILTDIRPVFDEDRDRVVGAVVGHRLRLAYYDARAELVTMTIAMEPRDVEQLQKACKDAINKGAVATDLVVKKAGLKPFVGGEDNDLDG